MGITLLSQQRQAASLLHLLHLRNIRDGVLCLRQPQQQHQQEYGAVIAVAPVNFALMSDGEQEAILEGFRALLQRLPLREQISIHIRTRPYDLAPYLDRLHEAQRSATSEAMRAMAHDHEQFVLKLASEHAILQREFYIRVSVTPEKSKRRLLPEEVFERVQQRLSRKCEDILEDLARSSLSGHRLTDGELAQYYLACVHAHYAEKHPLAPINLDALDLPLHAIKLKDVSPLAEDVSIPTPPPSGESVALILAEERALEATDTAEEEPQESPAPPVKVSEQKRSRRKWWPFQKKTPEPTPFSALIELLQPAMLEQKPHYIRVQRESAEYLRARAVVGYPAYVIAGWLDRLIQIEEPYIDVLLFIESLDPRAYTSKLTRKITAFRATQTVDARAGRTEDPYIGAALQDVEELRQQIVEQVEQVHAVSLYCCTRAASIAELRQRDEKMVSLLRSLDLESVELALEHVQAWLSCLPAGRDLPRRRKILETSSVVTAFPFASTSLSTEPGSLVGVMPSGSLVIINPVSDQLENGHEVVFARSGAGKSYSEKVRLARSLLMGLEAIVIDPEDEYLPLCHRVGGANIRLSSGRLQLNPFDLPHSSDSTERNLLEEKIRSLLVLFDLLLADKDTGMLSQREKGYLSKVITLVYAERGITSDLGTHRLTPPNMHDVYAALRDGKCGPDVFDLADRLQRHLSSFPEQTEVSLNNPLVVFNIRDLSDEIKPVGLFMITDFVWTHVRRERRPRPRLLIIDEAWVLMQFSEGGRFLAAMARRARKYNLCLRVITQDVEDFLGSEHGRTILKNAALKWLMKQDASTIDAVTQAFRLSEGERRYLLSCTRGEGLYFCNLSHVPLKIVSSPAEHQLATTNAQELLQRERAQQAATPQEAVAIEERTNEFQVVFPTFYSAHRAESE